MTQPVLALGKIGIVAVALVASTAVPVGFLLNHDEDEPNVIDAVAVAPVVGGTTDALGDLTGLDAEALDLLVASIEARVHEGAARGTIESAHAQATALLAVVVDLEELGLLDTEAATDLLARLHIVIDLCIHLLDGIADGCDDCGSDDGSGDGGDGDGDAGTDGGGDCCACDCHEDNDFVDVDTGDIASGNDVDVFSGEDNDVVDVDDTSVNVQDVTDDATVDVDALVGDAAALVPET